MSATYPDFFLKLDNLDYSFTAVPSVVIKAYNYSTQTEIGSIGSTDADGKIAAGSVTGSVGDLLRFRCENDGHGRAGFCQILGGSSLSQDIILRPSNGFNLVLRPQARRAYRAVAIASAKYGSLYWVEDGKPISSAQPLGTYPIGVSFHLDKNPPTDKSYWIIPVPFNRFDAAGYRNLSDVPGAVFVPMNRTTGSPVISQYGNSGDTSVTLKVSGYGVFDHFRWVRSADDSSVQQVETLTVVVTTVTAGTLVVTVTAAGMTGSPRVVNVTLAGGETDAQVATKIKNALAADSVVGAFFTFTTSTADVIAKARQGVANDGTMSFVITASHGVNGATSADTTAGVAGFSTNLMDSFVDLSLYADATYQFVNRAADTGLVTRYVKVAHSAKSVSGPWGPFSNVLKIDYSHSGSGGGMAPSDPTPPDKFPPAEIT